MYETLEDLCLFMEDHLYSLKEIVSIKNGIGIFTYNNDKSIN